MTQLGVPRSPLAPRLPRDYVLGSGVVVTDRAWTVTGGYAFPGPWYATDVAAVPPGTIRFYYYGIGFMVDLPEDRMQWYQRDRRDRTVRHMDGGYWLLGTLLNIALESGEDHARFKQQLDEPHALYIPALDIVEVAFQRLGVHDVVVVTADPGDGQRYPFCFHPLGPRMVEMLFVLRFFAEKRLLEEGAREQHRTIEPAAILAQLAHFQHVPSLAPYFAGAPMPIPLPSVPF